MLSFISALNAVEEPQKDLQLLDALINFILNILYPDNCYQCMVFKRLRYCSVRSLLKINTHIVKVLWTLEFSVVRLL